MNNVYECPRARYGALEIIGAQADRAADYLNRQAARLCCREDSEDYADDLNTSKAEAVARFGISYRWAL